MSLTVNNGYFCRELEGLQEVDYYKGSVNYGSHLVVRKPLSFQSAEWVWAIKKAYLESV